MDIPSLVAAQLAVRHLPRRRGARGEEAYWRGQADLPRPSLRLVASIATAAGLILVFIGVAQA